MDRFPSELATLLAGSLVESNVHGWQTQTSEGMDGRGEEGEMKWE